MAPAIVVQVMKVKVEGDGVDGAWGSDGDEDGWGEGIGVSLIFTPLIFQI